MVRLPVFFIVTGMLFISDAAQLDRPTFRDLIEKGRNENVEALQLLGDLAALVKTYLNEVNNAFDRILENEKQDLTEHLSPLKTALDKELKALKQVKVECEVLAKVLKKDKVVCKKASTKIAVSLLAIVSALHEAVPEQNKKEEINAIVSNGLTQGTGDMESDITSIGEKILNIIE
ncbi:hypothetical protein Q1695_004342 [Nippostrongylus brasiliensis]|nr:hypothetical protein Q1695_004342 [Nippostrongylus brasiliensis]